VTIVVSGQKYFEKTFYPQANIYISAGQ